MAQHTRLTGAAGLTAAGLLAVTLLFNLEGIRLYVYRDVVGVHTYCVGETKDAEKKLGQRFTREQCRSILIERLIGDYEKGMRRCLTFPDILPEKTYVAFLSFTYNVGIGGFCRSSVRRHANAGDLKGACNALMLWVKPKVLYGRRNKEKKLCLQGVAEGLPVTIVPAPN